jgi:type I restriction-modification system DNA methylase subunit
MLNDLRSAGNAGEFYTPRAITQFMVQMVNPGLEKREKVLDPSCGIDAYCNAKARCAKPGNPGAKERAKGHGRNIKSYAKDSEELSTVAKYCVLFRNDPQLARLVSSNG